MPVKTAPYGSWESPLDLTALFERPSPPMFPQRYRGQHYWIEARAKEGGRLVLVRLNADKTETCLTPDEFNIRTRVHEYGGKCFVLGNGCIYFSNFSDQRLYMQKLQEGAQPVALTVDDNKSSAFVDLQLSPAGGFLIAAMETCRSGSENANSLVAIRLCGEKPMQAKTIARDADFYANPVVDQIGRRLAWIQWSHPYMPWDKSTLFIADIIEGEAELTIVNKQSIVGSDSASVCQLAFYQRDLVFAMDSDEVVEFCDDFWNLHRFRDGVITRLTCDEKEYGAPHWVFGNTNHAAIDEGKLVAKRVCAEGDELVVIDRECGEQHAVDTGFNALHYLHSGHNRGSDEILLVASSATEMPKLVGFNGSAFVQIKSVDAPIAREEISVGTPIQYPTRDGEVAHGYFYIPHNTRFRAPDDHLPPLLVMVHGGPTSRASRSLDLSRQYWTGIGFALFDVNHRGSTGHGRRYRQSLLGKWGQVDIDDIIDGIDFLINQSLVDPTGVFIRGKSAGGYTVLRSLTQYPHYFRGGACYYGIGNLSTLTTTTHKFESHYADRLIGESYDEVTVKSKDSEYYKRSPVHFMHKVSSSMILFQGLDDSVVPPDQSREVVAVLAAQNIEHEYIEYPGEGHGFRRSETNIDALQRETRFYRRILAAESRGSRQ